MDDRIEVFGDAGVTYANLHMGNALATYSENGYGYAVEKRLAPRDGAIRYLKSFGIMERRKNWCTLPAARAARKLPRPLEKMDLW